MKINADDHTSSQTQKIWPLFPVPSHGRDDGRLYLLQSLHVVYAGNFTHTVDNVLQMLQVGDIEHNIDIRLAIVGARFDIADVGLSITDHSSNLPERNELIVTT